MIVKGSDRHDFGICEAWGLNAGVKEEMGWLFEFGEGVIEFIERKSGGECVGWRQLELFDFKAVFAKGKRDDVEVSKEAKQPTLAIDENEGVAREQDVGSEAVFGERADLVTSVENLNCDGRDREREGGKAGGQHELQ